MPPDTDTYWDKLETLLTAAANNDGDVREILLRNDPLEVTNLLKNDYDFTPGDFNALYTDMQSEGGVGKGTWWRY